MNGYLYAFNIMQDSYSLQDRGNNQSYQKYLSGMDAVVVEKVASASVFFRNNKNSTLVDVGMASGTSSHILALLFPRCKIIGVDINPKMVEIAAAKYKLPNLEFRVDDGEKLQTFDGQKVQGFFNCSSIHHITSFNGYDPHRAYNTLKRQIALLDESGVLVVRDFSKPKSMEVILSLPANQLPDEEQLTDADLLVKFSREARSLSPVNERGFPIEELKSRENLRRFRLWYADALEFIRRKDYRADYDVEIQEEYGYFTQEEFESILSDLGARVMISYPVYNPWIIKNRYEERFEITDLDGKSLGMPPTNYIIAAEKVNQKGTYIKPTRQLPLSGDTFLSLKSYTNTTTGQVHDLAERPNPVFDLLPYFLENGSLKILARYGYPRPLSRLILNQGNIDNKNYSGYIPEAISAVQNDHPVHESIPFFLKEKANLPFEAVLKIGSPLSYFTSPGGIDEKVTAYPVKLDGKGIENVSSSGDHSGFKDSGGIREFDAIQLLKTAQVGALAEARLELNIYRLVHHLGMNPGKWLGEIPEIVHLQSLNTSNLNDLLPSRDDQVYVPSKVPAGFLKHYRTKFHEQGVENSYQILEYIAPSRFSHNTVSLLPLFINNNKYYLGIEKRYLPTPYIKEGKSGILTVPAYRLPEGIQNYTSLKEFILQVDFFGTSIISFQKLGEKYFPCVGLTPEQVYPHVVQLQQPTDELFWVSIDQLMRHAVKLRDGHLLVSLFRLYHALGWETPGLK